MNSQHGRAANPAPKKCYVKARGVPIRNALGAIKQGARHREPGV
jgi:hypothetical protein